MKLMLIARPGALPFCAEEFDYMKNFAALLAADLKGDPNAKVCLLPL